jgi:hypothetical protein
VEMWIYVNAALHELGHAVYDFFNKDIDPDNLGHDEKGNSKTGKDLMDYKELYKNKDATFSEEQRKKIKKMAESKE